MVLTIDKEYGIYKVMFPARYMYKLILLSVYCGLLVYTSGSVSGYHIDEGFQLLLSDLPLYDLLRATSMDAHPPLYSLLLHVWNGVFGNALSTARGLSILLSIGSGAVFYKTLRLTLSSGKSILGSILYATLPQVVIYGFVARNYALLLLLINLLLYYTLQTWQQVAKIKSGLTKTNIAILVALHIAILYTHNLGLIIIPVLHIVLQLSRPYFLLRKQYLGILLGSAISYIPWLQSLQNQIETKSMEPSWLQFYPVESMRDFALTIAPLYTGREWLLSLGYIVLLYGLTTIIWRKKGLLFAKTSAVYLVLLLSVLFAGSFVIPLFYYRYLVITLPILIYIVSHSFVYTKASIVILGVCMIAANLTLLHGSAGSMSNSEFFNIQEVLPSANQADIVVIDSPLYFYQLKHAGYEKVYLYDPQRESFSWSGSSVLQPQDYLRDEYLVTNKLQYVSVQGREFADSFFDKGYEITDSTTTKKANIYVLTRF